MTKIKTSRDKESFHFPITFLLTSILVIGLFVVMKYILSESFRNPFGIVNISFYQGKKFIESRPQGFIKLMNSSYLGYTLTCGHSWKNSINPNSKTIKSLIKNLQNSSIYTFAFNIINYNSNLQQHPVLPLYPELIFENHRSFWLRITVIPCLKDQPWISPY